MNLANLKWKKKLDSFSLETFPEEYKVSFRENDCSYWLAPLGREKEYWPKTSLKGFTEGEKKERDQTTFLISENEGLKYVIGDGKGE